MSSLILKKMVTLTPQIKKPRKKSRANLLFFLCSASYPALVIITLRARNAGLAVPEAPSWAGEPLGTKVQFIRTEPEII
jgi:hypothetical protein